MRVQHSQSKVLGAKILAALMADRLYRRIEYNRRREAAGIVPCLHVAVVSYGTSSHNSSFSVSSCASNKGSCIGYEHHAIFDRDRDEYIHVTSNDEGEFRVVRTLRRAFEAGYTSRPRVVRLPSTTQVAYQILERARWMVDGDNQGSRWEYHPLTNNCEHFVNFCWDPQIPPRSDQVNNGLTTLAGSMTVGALGAGIPGTIVAATVTPVATAVTTTSTYYALGFIPWGTAASTTTVMANLPVGAVIAISAGSVLAGATLLGAAAYGYREWCIADAAANANMLPIAVYNTSNQPITASLSHDPKGGMAWALDSLYYFRSWSGVGLMSRTTDSQMAEELNPPTSTEDDDDQFVLTIECQPGQPLRSISSIVCRGDVLTFDGQNCTKQDAAEPEECGICLDRRPNALLQPCGHWGYCEACIQQVQRRTNTCPTCRGTIEAVDVAVLSG